MDGKQREAFSKKLLAHRKRLNLTQYQVASCIKVDIAYYSRMERGKIGLSELKIRQLCSAMNLEVKDSNELFFAAGFMPPSIVETISSFDGDNIFILEYILEILREYSQPELNDLYNKLSQKRRAKI